MAVITKEDVQQWLEETKLTQTELDVKLEATARTVTYAILGGVYDSTSWVTPASTPAAIRTVVGLLVAAWTYNKFYSENDGVAEYGLYLEEKAMAFLEGIKSGENDLEEIPSTIGASLLAFYPTDATGATDEMDASGNVVVHAGDGGRQFYMGTRW